MEMKEIEEFERKSNMSLFESLFSNMWSWQTRSDGEKKSDSNKILEQNLKVNLLKVKGNIKLYVHSWIFKVDSSNS